MQLDELEQWVGEFGAFHQRIADLFHRQEPRPGGARQALKVLRSPLTPVERTNAPKGLPQMAEANGDKTPDATQRLLYQAKWVADTARDRLQQFVIEVFGTKKALAWSKRSG